MTRIAVIGGGVTGLVAARRLAGHGFDVTVFEASDRLGGQIRTEEVAGLPVDVGAEALHLAGPQLAELCVELNLRRDEIRARPGTALIWSDGKLRPLPAGVGPTGPTRLRPVLASRILSPRGLARAAMEPFVTRGSSDGDQSVGAFIARRFGNEVTDRLVDPLLGSLHSGDVRRLSLEAATPHLAAQAARHRSMLLAARSRPSSGTPSFLSFAGGLNEFSDALLANTGVTVRLESPVSSLIPLGGQYSGGKYRGGQYQLQLSGDQSVGHWGGSWDGVILASQALAASQILRVPAPAASTALAQMTSASVATVVLAFSRADVEPFPAFRSTGMLVPSRSGRLLKAATFLSVKWPHLSGGDMFLIRMSAGRARSVALDGLDDEQLVTELRADLAEATGLRAVPITEHVRRWPNALPQLEVGHVARMRSIRRDLEHLPGVMLAGASYEGLGIASCVASGTNAATKLVNQLKTQGEAA